MGKVELGTDFYGVMSYRLPVFFEPEVRPIAMTEKGKHFSIDSETARVAITRPDYWTLFRDYVSAGAKTRFCCGNGGDTHGACCCGGWVHDAEKREPFAKLG
ncbi:hypothetical protein C8J57DRAFT_1509634 [Mycena rebaudengoi]|nr:hypothetical protein C8J57DRAFT_1509634 [Mycena rebaudengoi]